VLKEIHMYRTASALIAASVFTALGAAQTTVPHVFDPRSKEASVTIDASSLFAPAESKIDVVFVLDTTGSMGGLIEGAKAKIWEIANQIATAKPRPVIRMGLVAYRDRSDDYVTKLTALTSDLDAVYSSLMGFAASGGGDGPESVNQALNEALTKFEWDTGEKTLRMIFLVGDAPPHMDYPQDVLYPATCERAAKAGVIINTVQCGGDSETARVWQEIARAAEGNYIAIQQSGGVVAIATPFDKEIAELGKKIDATVIGYGTKEAQMAQSVRMARSSGLSAAAPASAGADRAVYKASEAGESAVGGSQELVNDVKNERVKVRELKDEELPEEMRKLSADEREKYVVEKAKAREEIQKQINELNVKRQKFIDEERKKSGGKKDSFDSAVYKALKEQAAKRGIEYSEPGK